MTGTGAMSLSEGENTVEVTVTSEDGTETGTYMVMVTREEMSDEARLLARYDTNGDGIDDTELGNAIVDYVAGDLPPSDMSILIFLWLG